MQSPLTAVPAFGGGQVYVHTVPAWSVPAAPAQAQQASHRPDPWEEHWAQPRTAWADQSDEDWEVKGGKHGKGGKGRRMHYDD